MVQELVSKISSKTFGKITIDHIAALKDKQKKPLMRVIGMATSYKVGTTDIGAYIKFLGRFQATSAETGEIVYSGTAILPKVAQDLLHGQLDSTGGTVGVNFAFDIGIQRDDASATKYVFTVTPLLEMSQDDPLLKLAAMVNDAAPVTLMQAAATKLLGKKPVELTEKVAA